MDKHARYYAGPVTYASNGNGALRTSQPSTKPAPTCTWYIMAFLAALAASAALYLIVGV